jgi:hypothetical protein
MSCCAEREREKLERREQKASVALLRCFVINIFFYLTPSPSLFLLHIYVIAVIIPVNFLILLHCAFLSLPHEYLPTTECFLLRLNFISSYYSFLFTLYSTEFAKKHKKNRKKP